MLLSKKALVNTFSKPGQCTRRWMGNSCRMRIFGRKGGMKEGRKEGVKAMQKEEEKPRSSICSHYQSPLLSTVSGGCFVINMVGSRDMNTVRCSPRTPSQGSCKGVGASGSRSICPTACWASRRDFIVLSPAPGILLAWSVWYLPAYTTSRRLHHCSLPQHSHPATTAALTLGLKWKCNFTNECWLLSSVFIQSRSLQVSFPLPRLQDGFTSLLSQNSPLIWYKALSYKCTHPALLWV